MIEIFITKEFTKNYQRLPLNIKRKAEAKEKLFKENPFNPLLHTEKLYPKSKEVWSFRIDRKYRIIFKFKDFRQAVFMTVGPHSWIYRFYF